MNIVDDNVAALIKLISELPVDDPAIQKKADEIAARHLLMRRLRAARSNGSQAAASCPNATLGERQTWRWCPYEASELREAWLAGFMWAKCSLLEFLSQQNEGGGDE